MLVFPNCKINLGLHIVGKRPDGFHNLETVFYPVPFTDALEVIIDPVTEQKEQIRFATSGLPVAGDAAANLCVKAWQLLLHDFPGLPSIHMHLHKVLPMGAGLGGGSSDGAFALQLLNQKLGLGLTDKQLHAYALQLGSDCPFFLLNKPCFATGRGEQLQPIDLSLAGYHLLLINPGIHVSTSKAFAAILPALPPVSASTIIAAPVSTWKNQLSNDFETGVFSIHPALAQIKQALYQAGAIYASMTGTGSTVFGIFQNSPAAFETNPSYFVKELLL